MAETTVRFNRHVIFPGEEIELNGDERIVAREIIEPDPDRRGGPRIIVWTERHAIDTSEFGDLGDFATATASEGGK